MKLYPKSPLSLLCLVFTVITLFSCSKDSDLLADYVALDPDIGTIAKFVANDTYQISIISNSEDDTYEITVNSGSGGTENSGSVGTTMNDTYQTSSSASIVLDVLANDTFKNKEEVVISENSQPENGDVVINSDNTLTYTPFTVEAMVETFNYTVEFVKEDGTVGKETGTVTVTVSDDTANKLPENISNYGVVGDGSTDDTKAIQAAFDSGNNIVFDGAKTYKVSGSVYITGAGDQTIEGNSATIFTTTEIPGYIIEVDKPSGVTYLNNLEIDGNLATRGGITARSSFDIDNVHVVDLAHPTSIIIGFYFTMQDTANWTIAEMTNSSAVNMRGPNAGEIQSSGSAGVARCLQAEAMVDTGIGFNIEDCLFERAVGSDGDPIFWRVSNFNNSNTDVSLTLNRCTVKYGTRRVMKVAGGEFYAYNSTFTAIALDDADIGLSHITAGFIAFQGATYGLNQYYLTHNAVFDNCTFNGSNFDNRLVQTDSYTDIKITNSTWNNGTEFRMWRGGGGVCITNNTLVDGNSADFVGNYLGLTHTSKVYAVTYNDSSFWLGPMVVSGNGTLPSGWDGYTSFSPPAVGGYTCP